MSKTRDACDDSFLKFACYLDEELVANESCRPDGCAPPMIADPTPLDAALLRDWARRHEAFNSYHRSSGEEWLRARGRSESFIRGALGQDLISDRVAFARERAFIRYKAAPPPAIERDSNGFWRPARRTVTRIIAGTHYGLGAGNRADTAKLLNRGLPKDKRNRGVTASEVRNALYSLASRHGNGDYHVLEAIQVAHRAQALDLIWRGCLATPAFRRLSWPRVADRLLEHGDLFDWYEEACTQITIPRLDPSPIISLTIKVLEGECARRGFVLAA